MNAARVVKAYVRADHEVEKFGKVSTIVFKLFTKAEKIVAWNSPVMQFTVYAVVIIMVLIGGESIISGSMQTGELTSVIVYALQMIWVCTVCGFVYVGDKAPELCPVCKVPAWKFEKVERRVPA